MVMKNDLAFVLAGTLNLYEHQSTINPNMPVRMLVYLAQEYQKVVETAPAPSLELTSSRYLPPLSSLLHSLSSPVSAEYRKWRERCIW